MKNWTKFGTSIKLVDETFKIKVNPSRSNFIIHPPKYQEHCFDVDKKKLNRINNETNSERTQRYGAYYLKPSTWSRTEVRKKDFPKPSNMTRPDGRTKNITTKSFENFLKSSRQYEKTNVLKEILQ